MNESKMEFIYFGWPSQLGKCTTTSIRVNSEIVERTNNTKYLGAYLDSQLDFKLHIQNKCKAAMANLFRIKTARKNLTKTACNKVVVLVLSHLEVTHKKQDRI